jgi:hypothetical protein
VRRLKADAGSDLSVSGPQLAASAFRAGLSTRSTCSSTPSWAAAAPALPDDVRVDLELLDEHRFANGVVHLHHRVRPTGRG